MSYKSVWDFGRGGKANYSVHNIGEYPSKIRPIAFRLVVDRFSNKGDVIFDPFCGSGTLAVEAKLQGRSSINYDINKNAIDLTKQKLDKLNKSEMIHALEELMDETKKDFQTYLGNREIESKFKQIQAKKEAEKLKKEMAELDNPKSVYFKTTHIAEVKDVRNTDLPNESVDAIITDIPYANMIRYSDNKNDLSTIENYAEFLKQLNISFQKMIPALKKDGYCVIFVADYRVAASREILPIHSDVTQLMRQLGLTLFDTYIWRYYRSGGFRPFGKKPFQAMNIHTYILVFHKDTGEEVKKANSNVKYRKRLVEKISNNKVSKELV